MRNSCCLLELVLSTKIKKQRKTLNRFQLLPCHCCCQNSSASLLGGQRGNVDHALATFANVSKLGRKEQLPLSCLARYWSAKAGEQGHWTWPTECQACGYLWQNGKIELSASSLKTNKTFTTVCAQWLLFSCFEKCWSLGNHAKGLKKMFLPVLLLTTERAAESFCFLQAPGLLVKVSQTCAV